MAQPPVPGRGAGEQPGRDARLPGGSPGSRDSRLAAFAEDNAADRCPPGPWTGMVIRELLRRRPLPGAQVRRLPCGLPDAWDEGVAHEITAELGISLQAADKLAWLAWALAARVPRTGAALEAGIIDYVKG
jgi:hypothetical protein